MTKLDDVMLEHMAYIVLQEKRYFTFKDFLIFEVDGIEYYVKDGTFRNKISEFIKAGQVEMVFCSSMAFYTLKGYNFGKDKMNMMMTPYHTGDNYYNNIASRTGKGYLYNMIQNLPLDKKSIHDIRLKFRVKGLWLLLSSSSSVITDKAKKRERQEHNNAINNIKKQDNRHHLSINNKNKDITLPTWYMSSDLLVKVTVHKTDTVSVIIACSVNPITLDIQGIIRLTEVLSRTEERISNLSHRLYDETDTLVTDTNNTSYPIPHYTTWNVTMWHFGADSLTQFTGEKFSITFQDGRNVLLRIYSKERQQPKRRGKRRNTDTRIRIERQEYPNKSVEDAINERLD